MAAPFKTPYAFTEFSHAVRAKTRFVLDHRSRAFLRAVGKTAEDRVHVLESGNTFWRAQLGSETKTTISGKFAFLELKPFSAERMKPLRTRAHEGRVNAKGIPCLYSAGDYQTAVAEVRPWVGAQVSVATLQNVEPLRLVNCGSLVKHPFPIRSKPGRPTTCSITGLTGTFFETIKPSPEERTQLVWHEICRAFSRPVKVDLDVADYAPTQILAEHLKSLGYDGVMYKSELGPGTNFAIFDIDALEVVDIRVLRVRNVCYEIDEPVIARTTVSKPKGDTS